MRRTLTAAVLGAVFLICSLLLNINCRPPQPPPTTIWLVPETESLDEVVDVAVLVRIGDPITSFGLEVLYNPAEMEFERVGRGELTSSWHALGWNELEPGRVILGGYIGAAAKSLPDIEGSLIIMQIRLREPHTTICVTKYVDGLKDAYPNPYCAEVRIDR